MSRRSQGFTLIEILIAFAILTLLALMGFMAWQNQAAKARDARRKADIKRLNIAFEDYYGDKDCYPLANILENCGGDQLKPWLDQPLPCDPLTNNPYCYVSDGTDCSQEFRILASLENASDPDIGKLGCAGTDFCGYEEQCNIPGSSGFNFGFSSTNIAVLNPNTPFDPGGGSSPSPSTAPLPSGSPQPYDPGNGYIYACVGSEGGDCNSWGYGVPGCWFFNSDNCDTMCSNPAYWCWP